MDLDTFRLAYGIHMGEILSPRSHHDLYTRLAVVLAFVGVLVTVKGLKRLFLPSGYTVTGRGAGTALMLVSGPVMVLAPALRTLVPATLPLREALALVTP